MYWLSKRKYKIGLMIPTLAIYCVFIILPIAIAIYYSFTKYSGIGKARFIGFSNYIQLFQDKVFWVSLKNTVIIFVLAFVLLLTLSFLVALLLNSKLRGTGLSKALVFSPAIIAPIIVGIIWVYILDPNVGIINNILDALNLARSSKNGLAERCFRLTASRLSISGSSSAIWRPFLSRD